MNIYKLNDCDWVAANTMREAVQCLAETVSDGGVTDEFTEEFIDCPYQLTDGEMDELKLMNEEDPELTRENAPTFRQALDQQIETGEKFPCMFACTEC